MRWFRMVWICSQGLQGPESLAQWKLTPTPLYNNHHAPLAWLA